MKKILRVFRRKLNIWRYRINNCDANFFECPICSYVGPFCDLTPPTGLRLYAECPNCGAKERHRIQFIAFDRLSEIIDLSSFRMLHFAPEKFFESYFRSKVARYETADIAMRGVDHLADLRCLPFEDESFDVVYASHVLEHIDDDDVALKEIRRILTPSGIAILPVPIVANQTVEYLRPNPYESYHVRAPGLDYFERYRKYFCHVIVVQSRECAAKHQCYTFEDRSGWPSEKMPMRPSMLGIKHEEYVPICFVSSCQSIQKW